MDDGGGQFHQILYTVVEFVSQVVYILGLFVLVRALKWAAFSACELRLRIWPGMLPLYLHIGGFNVCCRGILLVLVAWVLHDILGIPNFMRLASTHISDRGGKRLG